MSKSPLSLLVLLTLAVPLSAQQEPTRDPAQIKTLQASADSLARLWSEADALANLSDSLTHDNLPRSLDTLRVGGLLILSNRSSLPLKAAAELAWPGIDSLYGTMAESLASRPYLIHAIDPDSVPRFYNSWGIPIAWDKSVKEMADLLSIYAPVSAPDRAFDSWAGGRLRPATRGMRSELEQSYIAVVTSHFGVAQDCFTGSMEACRSLLGIEQPANPLHIFRTPKERQEAIRSIGFGYTESAERAAITPCTNGDDAACIKLMSQIDGSRLPPAIALVARQTLIRIALQTGGREAYSKLMGDSTQPMNVRLSSAAGVPLDSLVSAWHAAVISARPKSVELPAYGPVVGLAWTFVFGLMAVRSSRWRVA